MNPPVCAIVNLLLCPGHFSRGYSVKSVTYDGRAPWLLNPFGQAVIYHELKKKNFLMDKLCNEPFVSDSRLVMMPLSLSFDSILFGLQLYLLF